jgi:hypothetical protein
MAGIGSAVWEADAGYADPVVTTKGLLVYAVRQGIQSGLRTPVICVRQKASG